MKNNTNFDQEEENKIHKVKKLALEGFEINAQMYIFKYEILSEQGG